MSSSCSLFPANFRVKDTRLALISTSGAAGKQISSRRQASLANNRGYAGLETLIYQERLIRAMSGTPNLATQPVARETSTFGGTSTEELAYWLVMNFNIHTYFTHHRICDREGFPDRSYRQSLWRQVKMLLHCRVQEAWTALNTARTAPNPCKSCSRRCGKEYYDSKS